MNGISAQYVDGLEFRIKELTEQVEKLTEECVVLRASSRSKLETIANLEWQVEKLTKERDIKEHCIVQLEAEDLRMKEQLAALAEQNKRMRVALQAMVDEAFARNCGLKIADDALALPDLTSPVLNRIRAEGMRMAADICSEKHSLSGAEEAIRARADELTKGGLLP